MRMPHCPHLTLSLLHSNHTRHFFLRESTACVAVETAQLAWRQPWLMVWFKTGVALVPWWGHVTRKQICSWWFSRREGENQCGRQKAENNAAVACVWLWSCVSRCETTKGHALILGKVQMVDTLAYYFSWVVCVCVCLTLIHTAALSWVKDWSRLDYYSQLFYSYT